MDSSYQNSKSGAPAVRAEEVKWSRQYEANLLERCLGVARGRRLVQGRDEADICRIIAQLLTTRFPSAARELDMAAHAYFETSGEVPRPYLQVIKDGLVRDLPRLRHMMEKACEGMKTW